MRFSWVVLWLGVGAVAMFMASEWAMSPASNQNVGTDRRVRWYAPLPLVAWIAMVVIAAAIDLPG